MEEKENEGAPIHYFGLKKFKISSSLALSSKFVFEFLYLRSYNWSFCLSVF